MTETMRRDAFADFCTVGKASLTDEQRSALSYLYLAAKNTRAQASAPDGGEAVVSLINTCVGWVSAVARNGSLAGAAQDDIKREITNLFTHDKTKA
jgi:hypothetical protein